MARLLFVDDDKSLLRTNQIYFQRRGHEVLTADGVARARALLREHPCDCVILDILMPGMDGWSACREMKNLGIPVIFLTSLTERDCLYRGLSLGADDYMTKPYDLRELELRIAARIRARDSDAGCKTILTYPPLTIDMTSRRVTINDAPLALTAYEFDILLLLAQSPGQIFALEEIYQQVWQLPDLGNTQTVRTHLARMRHKLERACPERKFVDLSWGRGFFFQGDEKEETPYTNPQ